MRITFELETSDLERFYNAFDRARRLAAETDEIDIVDAAKQALDAICIDRVPAYVRKRLVHVQRLILMLEDEEWSLPMPNRSDALAALAYFGDPDDLIPDHIEVIGLIDDAIMLELIARRMRHVLQAYRQFCVFRKSLAVKSEDMETRRSRAVAVADSRAKLVEELVTRRERVVARIEQLA